MQRTGTSRLETTPSTADAVGSSTLMFQAHLGHASKQLSLLRSRRSPNAVAPSLITAVQRDLGV